MPVLRLLPYSQGELAKVQVEAKRSPEFFFLFYYYNILRCPPDSQALGLKQAMTVTQDFKFASSGAEGKSSAWSESYCATAGTGFVLPSSFCQVSLAGLPS